MKIFNPIQYAGWDDLLLLNKLDSVFYTAGWAKVLHDTYKYEPLYFGQHDNKKWHSLLPIMGVKSFFTGRRGVSLPFTDYCEPVVDSADSLHDILGAVSTYGEKKGWKSFELRGGYSFLLDSPPYATFYGHTLSLEPGLESIFSSFRDSNKRNIKKTISENIKTEVLDSYDSLVKYYQIHCLTRKRHGLPPQPFSFFKKIYQHLISQHQGIVILASYEDKIIAGAIYIHFGERAVYKFGASDIKYQSLRANNRVMWEAIQWYAARGYKTLCFGRTEMENIGLRQFKRGWGTKESINNYYKYDLKTKCFVSNTTITLRTYNKLFALMPLSFLKLIGSILYKHMG